MLLKILDPKTFSDMGYFILLLHHSVKVTAFCHLDKGHFYTNAYHSFTLTNPPQS